MSIFKSLLIVVTGATFIAPLSSTKTEAATINQVDPANLTGAGLIKFDNIVPNIGVGNTTNYDAVLQLSGASFAERFVGQTLSSSGNFDVLSGTPTGPLTLQAGNPGYNLGLTPFYEVYVGPETFLNGIGTLGPLGFSNGNSVGEGSFAALFNSDQSNFGFNLVSSNGGSATVNFFRRDGSLLDTIVLDNLLNTPGSVYLSRNPFGFSRDGGIKDIAGFSVHNNDPGGISLSNIRYDLSGVPGTPTPIPFEFSPSLGILLFGAWGLGARFKSIVQKRKSSGSAFSKN